MSARASLSSIRELSPPPAPTTRFPTLKDRVRQRLGSALATGFFEGCARLGRALPPARPHRHGVVLERDVPYLRTGRAEHTLDVYRPRDAEGPLPIVLYIHGGGFRILSKETHWLMGLAFARRGYLVFNINYRLAPTFPFPAALEDVAAAYGWVLENAPRFGGDLERLVVAGESAGANLTVSLTVAACYKRPEPFARTVWSTGVVPRAIAPACGLLQVSDPERFERLGTSRFLVDRVLEVCEAYFDRSCVPFPEWRELADPLLVLERGTRPARPWPATFAACGAADPLVDDTLRLKAALERLGALCEAPIYPREHHAFHAFIFRPRARQCWRDKMAFLERVLAARPKGRAA